MNLSKNVKITLALAPVAAGQTAQASDVVDMAGFDGVIFLVVVGTVSGSGLVVASVYQTDDQATYYALSGISANTSDNNKFVLLDVYRPTRRYLRVNIARATDDSVIGGVLAIQYRSKKKPTVHDASTLAAQALGISPEES